MQAIITINFKLQKRQNYENLHILGIALQKPMQDTSLFHLQLYIGEHD